MRPGVTSYSYDELGNQLTQTDAEGRTTSYSYDNLGRRVRRTLPGGQSEALAYNEAGNLTQRTDFNGTVAQYGYDALNRLLTRTVAQTGAGVQAASVTFMREYAARQPGLARNNGFYIDDHSRWVGPVSAFMAHDKAFPAKPDGSPHFHASHAFHLENKKLVAALERWCRDCGIEITDGTMTHADVTENDQGKRIRALHLESGEKVCADLYIDASGFRSELLGRALEEPYLSYESSLFCDRAVIAGWPRTTEPIKPYTIAETYEAGWCWQIEHEHWINRGYVYSSRFLTDDAARDELLRENPQITTEPRVVKFRSGRYARTWVGNVVGMGNSVGFVEPLEATALQVICVEARLLADTLIDALQEPGPAVTRLFNHYNADQWDDIRDFLAVHYAFNARRDSPFWRACRAETDLAGAAPVVEFFRENGPSALVNDILLKQTNSFGLDGYQAMLVGQAVPHGKPYTPPAADLARWREHHRQLAEQARNALTVEECLTAIRRQGVGGGSVKESWRERGVTSTTNPRL